MPVESSGSSSPTAAQPSYVPSSVVQIQSILTLQHTQSLVYPFNGTTPTAGTAVAIRLITPSAAAKSPLYFLTTPIDRTAATSEGSKLWQLTMKPWADQIDELVIEERYADALALIDTLDATLLPDKVIMRAFCFSWWNYSQQHLPGSTDIEDQRTSRRLPVQGKEV